MNHARTLFYFKVLRMQIRLRRSAENTLAGAWTLMKNLNHNPNLGIRTGPGPQDVREIHEMTAHLWDTSPTSPFLKR